MAGRAMARAGLIRESKTVGLGLTTLDLTGLGIGSGGKRALAKETLTALRRVAGDFLGLAALTAATFFRATFAFAALALAARAGTILAEAGFFAAGFAGLDLAPTVERLAASFRAGVAFLLFVPGSARFM